MDTTWPHINIETLVFLKNNQGYFNTINKLLISHIAILGFKKYSNLTRCLTRIDRH